MLEYFRTATAITAEPPDKPARTIREVIDDVCYKVIDAPRAEFYDLINDPGEERNVLVEHPSVAAAMLHRLRAFESGQEPPATPSAEVDTAVLDRIASLGYVGSIAAQASAPIGEQTDPKDRIAVFNKITSLQWENTERRRSLCR